MRKTKDEIIRELKQIALDPRRRTTMWEHFYKVNTPENMRLMLEMDAQRR
jgi:hypothetical protein